MKRPSRRTVLTMGFAGGVSLLASRLAFPPLIRPGAVRPVESLSDRARRLVARAFAGVDPARLWDLHVHLVGVGTGGSGCSVHPDWRSHLHPIKRLRFELYLAAAGVDIGPTTDQDYVTRLLALHRAANPAGRLVLLAFDRRVDEDGNEDPDGSEFHTPTEWVLEVARAHPELVPCASIHPYRRDALARLDAAVAAGARAVKWLPNAMGIDPGAARCDAFYRALADHGLPLVTHAGAELAVDAEESQELGNPLRLRRPLDHGVKVAVAHCASLGTCRDLDAGGDREIECFDAFLRLMGEPAWSENLWGEISALTIVNRCGRPLRELLAATELHPRLVNGSDYPLSAIDPLVLLRFLGWNEVLDPDDRAPLSEIFDANPLLFDFVLKRALRVAAPDGPRAFAPEVFETARLFD
jgi:mannonate dehydratase